MTSEALRRVVVEYIKAVMQKRITFKNADERREGAERMIKEADQFKFLFRKLAAVSSHIMASLYCNNIHLEHQHNIVTKNYILCLSSSLSNSAVAEHICCHCSASVDMVLQKVC